MNQFCFSGGWISIAIMIVVGDIRLRKLHTIWFDKFNCVIVSAFDIESIIAIGVSGRLLNEISICIIQVDAYAANPFLARILNPVAIRIKPDLIAEKCPRFHEHSLTDFTSARHWNFRKRKFAIECSEKTIGAFSDGKLKDIGCKGKSGLRTRCCWEVGNRNKHRRDR